MERIRNVENSDESVAVIWYDGRQECKIVNVIPHENTERNQDFNSDNMTGINNAAFRINDSVDNIEVTSLDSSSIAGTLRDNSKRTSRITSLDDHPTCSTSYEQTSTSSSIRNGHINPAFEMPNELSNKVVVKRSPVHPNVFLVRNDDSELSSCSCPSGSNTATSSGNKDELVLQIHTTELDEDLSKRNTTNNTTDTLEKRLHFLKRGTPISPECSLHISDITDDYQQEHCPNCNNSNHEGRTDGEGCCEPPPNYSSLRFMFLEDEPPKYQDVTGKKLNMGDPPKIQTTPTSKWKRRLILIAVIIFIILIGALLVYACFVSGHPLGVYGGTGKGTFKRR